MLPNLELVKLEHRELQLGELSPGRVSVLLFRPDSVISQKYPRLAFVLEDPEANPGMVIEGYECITLGNAETGEVAGHAGKSPVARALIT